MSERSECPKCGLRQFHETRKTREYCQCETTPEPAAREWDLIQGEHPIALLTLADGPMVEPGVRIRVIEYSAFEKVKAERDDYARQFKALEKEVK